jgi:undecaprenyl diphosphate synthase
LQALYLDLQSHKVKPEKISEELITSYMDTAKFCDLDLLIRTGGERRLSNFMLWQMHYAEIFFTDVLWPDFSPQGLLGAILDFQKRQRNKGA